MSNTQEPPQKPRRCTRIEPWRVHPLPAPVGPSAPYRSWIELPGSMTGALGAYLAGTPVVSRIYEGPGRLAAWEARLLGAPARRAYVREVRLAVSGELALSARTLSLQNDPVVEVLRRLSNRPLAEVLFQDLNWHRLTPPIPLFDLGRRRVGRACLWGHRRQGRRWNAVGSRILVTEYFEPVLAAD